MTNMTPYLTQGRQNSRYIGFLKYAVLAFSLLYGCIFSTAAHSTDNFLNSVRLGLFVGLNYGEASIESTAPNNNFTRKAFKGPLIALSGVAEKPITNIFRLRSELHFSSISELNVLSESSSATGGMISLGGILGRIETSGSPYFSASVGYSYIDIKRVEVSSGCLLILCSSSLRGANARGLGYRIAVGLSLGKTARLEIAYLNHGGEASGQREGLNVSMDNIRAGVFLQLK